MKLTYDAEWDTYMTGRQRFMPGRSVRRLLSIRAKSKSPAAVTLVARSGPPGVEIRVGATCQTLRGRPLEICSSSVAKRYFDSLFDGNYLRDHLSASRVWLEVTA